jgi:LmbE family N-acetylglucosaminyl deacetylase
MAGFLRPKLRVAHRRLQTVTARDVTTAISGHSTLVIAPHPDDETLGCGGTIVMQARSGAPLNVVVVSDGSRGAPSTSADPRGLASQRERECLEACRRLGVSPASVDFLRLPDAELASHIDAVRSGLRDAIATTDPDVVISPLARDAHVDHRIVGSVVDEMLDVELAERRVLAYPLWFWNRWAWTEPARSPMHQRSDLVVGPARIALSTRWRKVRIGDLVATKRSALGAHTSQVEHVLDPQWVEQFMHAEEIFLELSRFGRR